MRHVPALFLAFAAAVSATTSCSTSQQCPEEAPCCSQYGQCGTGTYCLGGCDPLSSFSLDSCAPAPICKNQTYSWDNLDNAILYDQFLGNATKYDWVYSGYPKVENGSLMLTMPNQTTGSLVSLNHYIWYGKVSAKVKSSRGGGVITGFILMSDDKDEIDYEWVGYNLTSVQTDFYFQGVQNYSNEVTVPVDSNTYSDWHEYTIDWKPDAIDWLVDGKVLHTLTKNSTYNATANRYQFPQSPSRLEMSLWPGGLSTAGTGTIEWAGGLVDWDSDDIKEYGYYYAMYKDITIECYSPPEGTIVKGDKSYVYTSYSGLSETFEVSGNDTVLNNLQDTGLNMTAGSKTDSSSSSGSSSGSGSGSGSGSSSGSDSGDGKESGASSRSENIMQGSLLAAFSAAVVFSLM
ncbi:hypothetical protein ASPWEDRAFT_171288 [Aspergillus wentii DTO 134E9]|uniref:Crh-like protein n=1 Tax=Aspergillus wentii DTO 134E9 TaxID=1073089 RepID=A0A1L9RSN7_ASPWE|nr:uncharacterized protein ASPWEDRAFT_171288 [Aspergillus wentii DTO 134E9]KAI9930664.1 hypothetical protein MW887_011419 [Aspergillus wentii]OJJ37827.1 hypothetical protein ASPWEDRAFT_171288 [Aspergillus wentii DTO 134E9]